LGKKRRKMVKGKKIGWGKSRNWEVMSYVGKQGKIMRMKTNKNQL
jgi:hypothetical protein